MHTQAIRVMIVDDQAVVRSGLSTFLTAFDDLNLVAEAGNGYEAVRLCDEKKPDVIIMDLKMPEMDGVEATRAIRLRHPEVQVIVLTSFPEEGLVQKALQAGAISYLLKNTAADELVAAVRAAYHGRPTLAPEATQALIHAVNHPRPVGHDLTSRELEVLELLARGLSNLEIADRLVVSRSTVKFHVSSILAKLDVSTRTEAVSVAMQHNLVQEKAAPVSYHHMRW
ncbi:two component transcriptional regulator, LuxR family [Longilinea arvoryzae]|uniref:Two component transcriptional regulator, LuxR family n=1 Tax=Longilinea arvoryzae TaxID=360412 RepID=A0A0S7BGV8_9CHLR|nr:response regulator transcription factor [Longilinea arvoryzae]GAP13750.1 two component transcriptional regulator, LuxR family [Longilinea arvoryzae]